MVYGESDQLTEPEVASASGGTCSSGTREPSLASWIEAGKRLESAASRIPNAQNGVALAFWAGIFLGFTVGVLF